MARGFRFTRWLGIGLLAELVVFVAIVDRVGLGWALLATLASSLFGVAMLRRSGQSAIAMLRRLNEQPLSREGALVDGVLGALGAVLLILPGFLTDLAGLVLLAPSIRQGLVRRLGLAVEVPLAAPRRPGDRTIDLAQGDWTRLDHPRNP